MLGYYDGFNRSYCSILIRGSSISKPLNFKVFHFQQRWRDPEKERVHLNTRKKIKNTLKHKYMKCLKNTFKIRDRKLNVLRSFSMTVLIWFWNLGFDFVLKWVDSIPCRTSYLQETLKVKLENRKPWTGSEIMEGKMGLRRQGRGRDSAPPWLGDLHQPTACPSAPQGWPSPVPLPRSACAAEQHAGAPPAPHAWHGPHSPRAAPSGACPHWPPDRALVRSARRAPCDACSAAPF